MNFIDNFRPRSFTNTKFLFTFVTFFTLFISISAEESKSFFQQVRLTGDWGGFRTSLEDWGFTLGGSYEMGYSKNLHGGIDTEGDSYKQRLTLNATLDLDKILGWKGATFFVQYQNHTGAFATDEVGDIQQFDGLDDPEYDRIQMFWLEQWLFDNKVRIKIGKVEPKSEFFGPLNAKSHLGFSTERSPTIGHGPPADSVNLFIYPTENFQLGFGAYDGAFNEGRDENKMKLHSMFGSPADTFYVGEAGYSWNKGTEDFGRVLLGYWKLTGDHNRHDSSGSKDSTEGGYIVLDQTVYKENNDKDDNQGIGIYVQYGFADEDVRTVKAHYGLGFQWTGAIQGRDEDVFGMGISHVELSDAPGTGFTKDFERAWEVFYKGKLTPFAVLQGDLQYIENPGGVSRSDALVFTLRLSISL